MKLKKVSIVLIMLLIALIMLPSISFSQDKEYSYNKSNTISLSVSSIENLNSFDVLWIDENRVIYVIDRKIRMLFNPNNPDEMSLKNLSNFIWQQKDGSMSHIEYIEDKDIIIVPEETPDRYLNVFNGNGEFITSIAEDTSRRDYKLTYLLDEGKLLILVDNKVIIYNIASDSSTVISDNAYSYKYFKDENKILVLNYNDAEFPEGNRIEYNANLINLGNNERIASVSNVTDAYYIPSENKLYYTKNDTFNEAFINLIDFSDDANSIEGVDVKICYNDFLYNDRYDLVYEQGENIVVTCKNIMSLKYSESSKLYIWTELYLEAESKEEVPKKTLKIGENVFDEGTVKYTIEEVTDFSYNPITDDLIIFYYGGEGNYTKIELRNLNDFDNPETISIKSINTDSFFYWYKDLNIIVFLEDSEDGTNLVVYELENNKMLIKKSVKGGLGKYSTVDIINNEIITISYIDENNKPKSELYYISDGKSFEFEDSYYVAPLEKEGEVISLEEKTKDDETSGVSLNVYEYGETETTEGDGGDDGEEEKEPVEFGPYGIGVKACGNLNSMFVAGLSIGFGYEFAIFANMTIDKVWMVELSIFFGARNENFNYNTNTGLIPDVKTNVLSNITGFQLSGRYNLDTFNTGFQEPNDLNFFIPFGLRMNYNIQSILYVDSVPTDFYINVNEISLDVLGGFGFTYYITDKMDVFAELLLIVNAFPTFYKPNFTTGSSTDVDTQIPGWYWGIQLNIGFTAWKF